MCWRRGGCHWRNRRRLPPPLGSRVRGCEAMGGGPGATYPGEVVVCPRGGPRHGGGRRALDRSTGGELYPAPARRQGLSCQGGEPGSRQLSGLGTRGWADGWGRQGTVGPRGRVEARVGAGARGQSIGAVSGGACRGRWAGAGRCRSNVSRTREGSCRLVQACSKAGL